MAFQYADDLIVLDTSRDAKTVSSLFDPSSARTPAVRAIQHLIGFSRSLVVESHHVDEDFRGSFARLFYLRHMEFATRAKRVHLFARRIGRNDLLALSQEKKEAYLGHFVIRPSLEFYLGASVFAERLLALAAGPDTHLTVKARYEVFLAGNRISFVGAPWMQADQQVSACATAALWVASSLMSHRFPSVFRQYHAPQITELGNRRTLDGSRALPAAGLSLEQMVDALQDMGYEAYTYPPATRLEAQWLCTTYTDSGIPPIVILNSPGDSGHAVTAIGYRIEPRRKAMDARKTQRFPWMNSSQFVTRILVQDDGNGPMREMELIAWEEVERRSDLGDCGALVESKGSNPCLAAIWTGEQFPDLYLFDTVIAPVPFEVVMDANTAFKNSLEQVQRWRRSLGEMPEPVVLRTFLQPADWMKQHWLPRRGIPASFSRQIRSHTLPKWIWVTEVTPLERWRRNQEMVGFLIQDAGSHIEKASGHDFLAIHMPGALVLNHPNHQQILEVTNRIRYPLFRGQV